MADEAAEGIRNVHTRISDVSARLQNLRNLLNSERHTAAEQRRAIEALDQEVGHMTHEQQQTAIAQLQSMADGRSYGIDRRRPYVEDILSNPDYQASRGPPPQVPTVLNPSSLMRNRRRAFRPSERLTRSQRERLGQGGSLLSPASYTAPPPRPSPPRQTGLSRDNASETQTTRESRYRAKRRKLDDGTYEDESKAITYGWKGQVVPGQLKMEIISCDGGEYSDPHVSIHSYPQNVLQDDENVYCTKSNRCNMLLKHSSGMPFTLTKMVLKAPRSGYDAPIQEGMVFVALDDEHLLEKTARYESQYSPKSYRYHQQRIEAQHQEYINSARSPLRSIHRTRYLRDPREANSAYSTCVENDPALESAVVPGFSITTGVPSDDEGDSHSSPASPRPWHEVDPEYSFRTHPDHYRPVYADGERPAPYEYSSDSEDGDVISDLLRTGGRGPREDSADADLVTDDHEPPQPNARPYVSRHLPPGRLDLRSYAHRSGVGELEHVNPSSYERIHSDPDPSTSKVHADSAAASASSSGSSTLAPHARFFIPPSRTSVAIKFDPPVAGKYILIKLWASCPNGNIDIQCITAHGYGGPRFFPSIEPR